ncbi:MAG: hypothetical protein ACLPPF_12380 [Rhodomicrobium sp.]
MIITLKPDQEAWLNARVANGEYASVEEAVCQLIDERIAECVAGEFDDLAWAKPLVDEALADVALGRVMTLEEHKARTRTRLAEAK